jgi:hypothetical protein
MFLNMGACFCDRYSVNYSFTVLMPLFFFIFLPRAFSTMFYIHGATDVFVSFLIWRKMCYLLTTDFSVSCGYFMSMLFMLRNFPSIITNLNHIFLNKSILDFSNDIVLGISVKVIYYINWISYVESSFHCWNN